MPLQIIRNDITKVKADAIVNTANPEPVYASGTDTAIYKAAGADKLLKERKKIGQIAVGDVAITPAFALKAKYIIHAVGPAWIDGEHGEREAVRSCYEKSLALAKEHKCNSIAFPLIATGVYGFPKADALQIAISVFSEFLSENDMQIMMVVFDEESFVLSGKIFSGVDAFIDENYVADAEEKEYGMPPDYGMSSTLLSVGSIPEEPERRRRAGRLFRKSEASKGEPLAEEKRTDAFYEAEADEASFDMLEAAPMAAAPSMARPPRSLDDLMNHVAETWQESLFRLIDEKGYTDTEVYKRANVDRKLFSKIRSNASYQPKKITAVAFALALRLNLDETKDLLGRAGYALSPSSRFDLIVEYFIEQEVYDTYTINLALFEHKQPLLGD